MSARHKISRNGLSLIRRFEGLRQQATRLGDGRWSIGYGHTRSAREGARVSADDAEALLRFDLLPVVEGLNSLVQTPLNQNQFDALVSFVFNIGLEAFGTSDVRRRINEGRFHEAAQAMENWTSADYNGQTYVLAPLVRRRAAEKELFLTPDRNGVEIDATLITPGTVRPSTPPEAETEPEVASEVAAVPPVSDPPMIEVLPPEETSRLADYGATSGALRAPVFDDEADWTTGDGRVALSAEGRRDDGRGLWRRVTATLVWIISAVVGLAALGGAMALYYQSRSLTNGAGQSEPLTALSGLLAGIGLTCVCVSVYLILKRLGGLKD